MTAYYNEFDEFAAKMLRNLIAAGHIAPGVVDTRSIEDVRPSDLKGFTQCHFFAGIGVWSHALRRAGWRDDSPVWTGSCPCFPAGTLILTKKGQVPIENIVPGDEVLTHKGRWRRVLRHGSDLDKPIVELKGQGHWGFRCTPNHPIWSKEHLKDRRTERQILSDGTEWTPAENMVGKRWVIPGIFPQIPIPDFWLDKAEMLGFWVGNGWVSVHGEITLCDGKQQEELLRSVVSRSGLPGSFSLERTAIRWRSTRHTAEAGTLTSDFGKGATNKTIPTWLLGADLDFKKAFLGGWLLADGHGDSLTTASRSLCVSAVLLLTSMGLAPAVKYTPPVENKVIEGRQVTERGYWRISFSENPRSFKFSDNAGFGYVRKVRRLGTDRVFNLEVEDDNTYIADGITVHNCQPFSAAGKGNGFDDQRHLWPAFLRLIDLCRPPVVLGEQVASKDAEPWIDLVQADLEAVGYGVGSVPFPAASVGAPHIRDRLYWVGYANHAGLEGLWGGRNPAFGQRERSVRPVTSSSEPDGLGYTDGHPTEPNRDESIFRLSDGGHLVPQEQPATRPTDGFWRDADWLFCRDGKWRPVEPGTCPLADGYPQRVGLLRTAGNAIVAPQAQIFIETVMEYELWNTHTSPTPN